MEPSLTLAFILIIVGFVLLAAELFIPTGGVLFVLSVLCLAVGVGMAFYCDASTGMITLIVVAVALPVIGGVAFYFWPKTPIGKRMFLDAPAEDATLANMPVNLELEHLRGRVGRTLGSLRPAGIVDFDGRRVDVLTEGMMVDDNQWVKCIDVKAGKVIVRPVPKPNLTDLENADFS